MGIGFSAALLLFLPSAAAHAAEPAPAVGDALLGAPTGLLPQLSRVGRVPTSASRALSPGRLALKLQGEDDDDLVLPALVPLVDPEESGADAEGEGDSGGMSFEPIDLTDDESEGGDAEGTNTAAEEAVTTEVPPSAPEAKPIVYRWWFWAVVGVVAAAGGGAIAATSRPELVLPEGTLGTMDRR